MDLCGRLATLAGAASAQELGSGHQSRVFALTPAGGGPRVVAEVVDASLVDRATYELRVDVVARIARIDRRVWRPLPVDGRLVTPLDTDGSTVLVSCYELATGAAPVVADPGGADLMGQTSALLHRSMRAVPPTGGRPASYRSFDAAFVARYREVAGHDLDRGALDGFVDRRVAALASWLDDLTTAPPASARPPRRGTRPCGRSSPSTGPGAGDGDAAGVTARRHTGRAGRQGP